VQDLERLYKKGLIDRYLRIERGAYIYWIPGLHPLEMVQQAARDIVSKRTGKLARVLEIGQKGRILSIFELGRIINAKFYFKNQANPDITGLIEKLNKLGFCLEGQYVFDPSVSQVEHNHLITDYETSLDREANLLAYAKRLFIDRKMAEQMTLYRQPLADSLAQNKFDLFGHGGRINWVRIVVECNLRREAIVPDLEGFSQRIGGTARRSLLREKKIDRSPIARYYIAKDFSSDAIVFARRKEKRIRLLKAQHVLMGSLAEISRLPSSSEQKPSYYGRFKEVRGIAFEAEVEPVYRQNGFKTERRKHFFLDGNEVTYMDTGKSLTDVDLFASRVNEAHEIVLVECKSSAEKISRRKLFEKTKKYWRVADFLLRNETGCQIEIVVIANINETDIDELIDRSVFKISFFTPAQFYNEHPNALKGAPKWMFGL
jgi:hypothetical protein